MKNEFGLPIDKIYWESSDENPFGSAQHFNAIIFGNANNIVDIEGPLAVGGSFMSKRGCSIGYGVFGDLSTVGLSANNARLIIAGNASLDGALTVGGGHCVIGGMLNCNKASGYLIGKDEDVVDQTQQLTALYKSANGSSNWRPTDEQTYYVISCYDTPRYIPSRRISANPDRFFKDGYANITQWAKKLQAYEENGQIISETDKIRLVGTEALNVFNLNIGERISQDIIIEAPDTSTNVVNIIAPSKLVIAAAHIGTAEAAPRTVFNIIGARNIEYASSCDLYGSVIAPTSKLFIPVTGGFIKGNIALYALDVNSSSGFEFHIAQFTGSVALRPTLPDIEIETQCERGECVVVDIEAELVPTKFCDFELPETDEICWLNRPSAESLSKTPLFRPEPIKPIQPPPESTKTVKPQMNFKPKSEPPRMNQFPCASSRISGRVNARRGGYPVSDVEVKLFKVSSNSRQLVNETVTNRLGRFQFNNLQNGGYVVCIDGKYFGNNSRCSDVIAVGYDTNHEVNMIL